MRQTRIRMAVLVGMTPVIGLFAGCDSDADRADADVARLIVESGRANEPARLPTLEKAAQVAGASSAAKVNVLDILGDEKLSKARVDSAAANAHAAKIEQLIASLDRMTANVAEANRINENLKKFEPAEAKQSVAAKVKEVSDGTDGVWIAPLASLSATKTTAAELQQKITEAEGKVAQLGEQQAAALAEAEKLQRQSAAETGQAAVDTYKGSSGKRKEAMDLATQADVVRASLVPLRQDLAIAQSQEQLRAAAIERFEGQGKGMDEGWTNVQTASAQVSSGAKEIVEGDDTGPGSIAKVSTALATEMDEYERFVTSAGAFYEDAITHYDNAAKEAQKYSSELSKLVSTAGAMPEAVAYKGLQNTFTPGTFNLRKGVVQQSQATLLARRAELLTSRAKVAAAMAPVLQAAGLTAPAGAIDAAAEQAAKAAVGVATEAFTAASETLTTVSQAGGATPSGNEAKAYATVALMLNEYTWSQFATATGDTAGATTHLAVATSARGEAAELASQNKLRLPPMPPGLAAVAGPAPATTAPTAAPDAPVAPAATGTPTAPADEAPAEPVAPVAPAPTPAE